MDEGEDPATLLDTKVDDPEHHSSVFGETACGEPLVGRRIVMDFTPGEEDTEFVQKKCCAFWDFVSSCPELENYVSLPATSVSDRKSRQSDIELVPIRSVKREQEEECDVKTAVSMLEFVEEKGLITRTFEARLPVTCDVDTPDYFDDRSSNKNEEKGEACECKKVCRCKAALKQHPRMQSHAVQEMCRQLQGWDEGHPKSMEPPAHPPALDLQ